MVKVKKRTDTTAGLGEGTSVDAIKKSIGSDFVFSFMETTMVWKSLQSGIFWWTRLYENVHLFRLRVHRRRPNFNFTPAIILRVQYVR